MSTFTVPQPTHDLRVPRATAPAPAIAPVEDASAAHKSIGDILKVTIPATMVATFALTVLFVVLA